MPTARRLLVGVLLVLAAGLGFLVPAVAANDFAALLGDATEPLVAGDESGYQSAADQLRADPATPPAIRAALDERDAELLALAGDLLLLSDRGLLEVAVEHIEFEQGLVPPPPESRPEPGTIPPATGSTPTEARRPGQGPPITSTPEERELLRATERRGAIILDVADLRGLGLPASARRTLLMPIGTPPPNPPPPPATYEAARRELQEILADGAPSMTPRVVAGTLLASLVVGMALFLGWRRRHARTRNQLAELATTDQMTGLKNRRQLDWDLEARKSRGGRPTALLMIDLDHFKSLNDEHGHLVGDAALAAVAGAIERAIRTGDLPYRYGGEEFCVLLPDTGLVDAELIAERVRASIEAVSQDAGPWVTASIGVAAGMSEAVESTMGEADRALYLAKSAGRNRVIVA